MRKKKGHESKRKPTNNVEAGGKGDIILSNRGVNMIKIHDVHVRKCHNE
jgi:hypothetical protein